jgi:hypothetical protein
MTVCPFCKVTWNGTVMAFDAYAPLRVVQARRHEVRNLFINNTRPTPTPSHKGRGVVCIYPIGGEFLTINDYKLLFYETQPL